MTSSLLTNRNIRDEIRDYWSDRAETFDDDPGHKISEGAEMAAWEALFRRHLGAAQERRLLDLASGTGEIARLCSKMGFDTTGLDWSEPMLERARAKLPEVMFLQADAERTTLPPQSMDVVVMRHLVWTLVDPAAAFAEWHRVLKPGGILLIVDGDFVTQSWLSRLKKRFAPLASHKNAARHNAILSQVYFSNGARAEAVARLLTDAGFEAVRIDGRLGSVHRAQAAHLGWRKSLLRRWQHRYAISASKPTQER